MPSFTFREEERVFVWLLRPLVNGITDEIQLIDFFLRQHPKTSCCCHECFATILIDMLFPQHPQACHRRSMIDEEFDPAFFFEVSYLVFRKVSQGVGSFLQILENTSRQRAPVDPLLLVVEPVTQRFHSGKPVG